MATRTPLREDERSRVEHESHHHLLEWVEEWAEETGSDPEGEPGEGVPWHFALLAVVALAVLFAFETALVFGIAKLVTGHAY
jgi:hypothetical protein